jgi:hypothetical protein
MLEGDMLRVKKVGERSRSPILVSIAWAAQNANSCSVCMVPGQFFAIQGHSSRVSRRQGPLGEPNMNSTDSVLSQTGYNSEINYSACSILSRRNNSWCTRIYKHERSITFIYTN